MNVPLGIPLQQPGLNSTTGCGCQGVEKNLEQSLRHRYAPHVTTAVIDAAY